ncbi:MAG: hypothetical protein ISP49_19100 [Reyranella sp.]|nr:hypothetical protein [Reyranella sp.]MBL6653710.1 hypothetical protein [Reyranella sp.]
MRQTGVACAPRRRRRTVNQAKGKLENDQQSITIDTNDQLFQAKSYRHIIVA